MLLFLASFLAIAVACSAPSKHPLQSPATSAKRAESDSSGVAYHDDILACPDTTATTDNALLPIGDGVYVSLTIAPEDRCSEYDRGDYYYPPSVEQQIADRQGMVSLYTGRTFASLSESDIEHIVALSEAHDSGMCAATRDERKAFARDLDNLTLAAPNLNRHQKRAKDAAEWLPPLESAHCWFAAQVVTVKASYALTVDQAEYNTLKRILDGCSEEE